MPLERGGTREKEPSIGLLALVLLSLLLCLRQFFRYCKHARETSTGEKLLCSTDDHNFLGVGGYFFFEVLQKMLFFAGRISLGN